MGTFFCRAPSPFFINCRRTTAEPDCARDGGACGALGFDLADTLTGYVEQLAHFFEGMVGLFPDAEALAEHLLLTRRQIRQHGRDLLGELGVDHLFGGRDGLLVLDEIPKARIFLVADGGSRRIGLLGDR